MKKTLICAAAAALTASLLAGTCAFAESSAAEVPEAAAESSAAEVPEAAAENEPKEYSVDESGILVNLPESWLTEELHFEIGGSSMDVNDNFIITEGTMIAASDDDLAAAVEEYGQGSPEFQQYIIDRQYLLFLAVTVNDKAGREAFDPFMKDYLEHAGLSGSFELSELGSSNGWTYYELQVPDLGSNPETAADPDKAALIDAALADTPSVIEKLSFFEPVLPKKTPIGTQITFETTDLDGNPVKSEDLFSANEYTMVNYFFSTCPFCIEEMPDLVKLHESFREKGCGIVGITIDAINDQKIADNKKIVADNGITFPVIKSTPEMVGSLIPLGYPTTYFVDKNGVVVGGPIAGKDVEGYVATMDQLLAGSGSSSTVESAAEAVESVAEAVESFAEAAAPEAKKASAEAGLVSKPGAPLSVIVKDESGAPVANTVIQLCSDENCNLGTTDANGCASFDVSTAASYTVHVLVPAEGFAADSTEYKINPGEDKLEIALKKA
ncbi:MAG: redoxin domain-containing protein [Lachnospiraceae bacterium]|nr:redoxin domain-containing protein [Lachnospiraceae bacterium]